MAVNRRHFIRTLVIGTGAVFLDWRDLLASPTSSSLTAHVGFLHTNAANAYFNRSKSIPTPSRTLTTDVVICGGGTAGIAAAWRLKKNKRDFLLLENEVHLGGVMLNPSPIWKGIEYPLGSTYFARRDSVYKELLTDLGVTPIETGEDAFCFEGAPIVDPWNPKTIRNLPISSSDHEAFRSFRDFILALPLPTYPIERAAKDVLAEYDTISALTFVARFKSPVLTRFMELYARSVLGGSLGEVNAYSFLSFYSVEFGDAFNLPCWTLPSGLGAIASKAEAFIGSDQIKTNAPVVRVENTSNGVEVLYVDRLSGEVTKIKSKKAIVAAPKNIARNMVVGVPDFQSKAMEELRYAPYVTVALCCNAPLFKERAFDFWVDDKHGRFTDIIDVTSSQDSVTRFNRGGSNVYMVSIPLPQGSLTNLDESTLGKNLVMKAQEIAIAVGENMPGATEKIEELHVFGWTNSMVIPTVGAYQKLIPLISRPVGNIHFAHSDNDIAPGWENAVWHGVEGARGVMGG
jgi:protoporphyrinogen oxidase